MVGVIHEFIHEIVITVIIAAGGSALRWPFMLIKNEFAKARSILGALQSELITQRTNCLQTLQQQGDRQVDLLSKTVEVLGEMHTDSKLMLEHLRDKK
jgi:hypothetical protein